MLLAGSANEPGRGARARGDRGVVDIVKSMVSNPDSTFASVGLIPGDGNTGQGYNQVFGAGPCSIKQKKLFKGI